jgi:hypothetical protein
MTLTTETACACAALLLFTVAVTAAGYAAHDRAKQERRSADLDTAQNWLAAWRAGHAPAVPDGWQTERDVRGPIEVISLRRPGVCLQSLRVAAESAP